MGNYIFIPETLKDYEVVHNIFIMSNVNEHLGLFPTDVNE